MSSDVFLAVASCLAESCSATLAAVARQLRGSCAAVARQLRGSCAAVARQLRGSCAAVARQLRGSCAAVARLLALMLFSWASISLFLEKHAGLLIRARLLQRFAPITAWLILLVVGGGLARW